MLRAQAEMQPKQQEQGISVSYVIKYEDMKLGKELGKGGFGVVYQGTWRNRDVAVKQLLVKNLSDESKQEFESEAQIMANLKASNIVQFYGYCVSPERCLVMEYMPKGSLYGVLHSSQPLEWTIRNKIAMGMAVGVSILHAENVIHRDIKSLNVLLDEDFKAKLTDFGLSKVKHESQSISTHRGSAGTPAWMAPELTFEEGGCTKASDIYSLGITFWELASRNRPFKNVANPAIIPNKVNNGYRDPIPADCPSKVATLIQACWDTKPQNRPDADTVVTYLKSAFNDFPLFLKNSEPDSSDYRGNLESLPASRFHSNLHSVNPVPALQILSPVASTSNSTEGLVQELAQLKVTEEAKRLQLEKEREAEVEKRRQAEEKLAEAKEALQRREKADQLLLKQQAEKVEREKAEQARLAAEAEKKRQAEEQAMREAKQRQLFFKQQTETVSPQAVSALLKHVAEGEQDEAEALLKKTPGLALTPADVTDLSGRTFKGITAFQYAVWALDSHMWTMIRKYLPAEKAQEQAQGLQTGAWVKEHGKSASWQNLLDALQKYIDLCGKYQWGEAATQWNKGVGGAQRLLPAHVVNEYCHPDRPFDPCPDFSTGTLPRTRKTHEGEWFTAKYNGGDCFAVYRSDLLLPHAVLRVELWMVGRELKSCHTLMDTRAQQRDQLLTELLSQPQAYKAGR